MNADQTLSSDEHNHPTEQIAQKDENTPITPPTDLSPIAVAKRIDIMDVLRGFALIGILMMNIEWFNRTLTELGRFDFSLSGFDWSAGWFVRLIVEGKFYKLFSLLFGMGFAVMLLRAKDAGRPFGAWFSRRMIVLFLFGMAHMMFLWGGDILHDYAAGGMILLGWIYLVGLKSKYNFLQRFNSPRSFLRLGLVMLALPMVVSMGAGIFFGQTRTNDVMNTEFEQRKAVMARADQIKLDPVLSASLIEKEVARKAADEPKPEVDEDTMTAEELVSHKAQRRFLSLDRRAKRKAAEHEAFTSDSFWTATVYRTKQALKYLKDTPFFALIMGFPMFLVGYWFVASGIMRKPEQHVNLFKGMAWVGLGGGLFMATGSLLLMAHPVFESAIEVRAVTQTTFMFSQYLMTAGYVGAIALLVLSNVGKRATSWLAPMGRMALTNYISHSIILSCIFYGYAGGMYGEISRGPQMLMVVGIIAMQAVLSRVWLNNFKFGPLEWVWRSLTYWKVQPMCNAPKAVSTGAVQAAA
jgi:uncharacterized protein